ncbi:hypothetical protein LSCM4_05402 [Leishmania orientalis]|uniref:Actin-interacting protein-like protein n=1 Tax=Leishmania orientalis TaxID=2249476 RepID=A0A836GQ90_9TRYP|nr:hypothetical protein LSCM4_05402 [Leishmania orientalis]
MSGASSARLPPEAESISRSRSPPPPPNVQSTTRRPRSHEGGTGPEFALGLRSSGDTTEGMSHLRRCRARRSEPPSARACEQRHSRLLGATVSPTSPPRASQPLSSEPSRHGSSGGRGGGSHSATAAAAVRSPSSLTASPARRRAKGSRGRSPTLAIAEAEAVRAALEFSMDVYRQLHKRKFMSANEELDFLRKDFVASRKTLALLHEDNTRLERELMERVAETSELRRALEDAQREGESLTPAQRGWACSSGCVREDLGGVGPCEVCGVSNPLADAVPVHVDTAAEGADGGRKAPCGDAENASAKKGPSRVSAPGTGLSLYATSRQRKSSVAAARGLSACDADDADLQQLIRDLRSNLARRDTSLNEAQMELGELHHIRQTLETELRRLQEDLLEAKRQRDALQAQLTAQEELHAATAAQAGSLEAHVQQLQKEKDDMQRRLTTAELLFEHTGPMSNGGSPASVSGDGGTRVRAQEEALREQLQLYRSKWQAAEDQMEHLHERISQLQRQLVSSGADDGATAGPLKPVESEVSGPVQALVQEAKYTADIAALRRQHQEQLQLHIEEAQRLQRRLERAQENASFHEDQLRQQRQDDARQHHREMQELQVQLRTAQGELVKAQEDREHLARQLRRSIEQQTTVEVLRSQVDQLKQRLGEVGAELAQVRGREKELSLQAQRERLARAKAEHDVEAAQEMLEREKAEAQYLREELILAREQLGMHEASEASVTGAAPARPSLSIRCAGGATEAGEQPRQCSARIARCTVDAEGDAATLSSEVKGYVGLMRVNTALQRRIEELEAKAQAGGGEGCSRCGGRNGDEDGTRQAEPTAPGSKGSSSPRASPEGTSSSLALELQQQVEHLQAELTEAHQRQNALMESCAEREKERRQLIKDNQTLADGVELLEKQLRKCRAVCARKANERCAGGARVEASTSAPAAGVRTCINADIGEKPQRGCHRCCVTQPRESRARSRLQTARAQDRDVVARQSPHGKLRQPQLQQESKGEAAQQNQCPLATACTTRSSLATSFAVACGVGVTGTTDRTDVARRRTPPHTVSCSAQLDLAPTLWLQPQSFSSASAPSSPPSSLQPSRCETCDNGTVPPAVVQSRHASTEQREERIAPPSLSPCSRVHGSILPPVYYPSLVARSCD